LLPPPPASAYTVFAHLNAEKTPLYRAILGAARARFAIALRVAGCDFTTRDIGRRSLR
jgi:hypothetical protein